MQPTGFLCSLPDYRPTMAACKKSYARINAILHNTTHMGANVLSASAVVLLMIAGRSSGTIYDYMPIGAVTTLKIWPI